MRHSVRLVTLATVVLNARKRACLKRRRPNRRNSAPISKLIVLSSVGGIVNDPVAPLPP